MNLDVKLTTTITITTPIMVTGVISSMETAAVNLLNAVLHTAVSYIISIPTQDKDNNLWCGSHAYTTGCGPYSMLYTH